MLVFVLAFVFLLGILFGMILSDVIDHIEGK